MQSAKIEIREVTGSAGLKSFISVPWSIYKDDPNWIPPLKIERKEALSEKNPFFRHARMKTWVAYRNDQAVGRISAQIDELYLQHHDDKTGFFGMIEAHDDPEIFSALFETAESWLKEQGMQTILGPFNLGINQEIGCLVEGFDSPPYIMMGHARPYYGDAIESQGYEKATDTFTYEVKTENFGMSPVVQRLLNRQAGKMTLRQVDRKNTVAELEVLRSIFNDAWSENWGFVPFTREEFSAIGKELFMIVPPDYAWIGEVDGEPASFAILLPNVNELIADLDGKLFPFGWAKLLWRLKIKGPKTARLPLMGVRRKYHDTRLGPALAFLVTQALHQPSFKRGIEKAEMSWILEDNHAMNNIIRQIGGVMSKRYRMYSKTLG